MADEHEDDKKPKDKGDKRRQQIGIAAAIGVLVLTYLLYRSSKGGGSGSTVSGGVPNVAGSGVISGQTLPSADGNGNMIAMFSNQHQDLANQLGDIRQQQEAQFGYLNSIQGGVQAGLLPADQRGAFMDHYWDDPAWTPGGRWYRRPDALRPVSGPASTVNRAPAETGPTSATGRIGLIGPYDNRGYAGGAVPPGMLRTN